MNNNITIVNLNDVIPNMPNNVAKKGRPRDTVWVHYLNDPMDDRKVQCRYCTKIFSSPVSLALRAHLSNSFYAKLYKTTLCPMTNPTLSQQYISDFEERMTYHQIQMKEAEIVQQSKRVRLIEDHENVVSDAILMFFSEYSIPLNAVNSNSFVDLCAAVRNVNELDGPYVPSPPSLAQLSAYMNNSTEYKSPTQEAEVDSYDSNNIHHLQRTGPRAEIRYS
jgi:hypothetical protein